MLAVVRAVYERDSELYGLSSRRPRPSSGWPAAVDDWM